MEKNSDPLAAWNDAIAYQQGTLRTLRRFRLWCWLLIAFCGFWFGFDLHHRHWFWAGIMVGLIVANAYTLTQNTESRDRTTALIDQCIQQRDKWLTHLQSRQQAYAAFIERHGMNN